MTDGPIAPVGLEEAEIPAPDPSNLGGLPEEPSTGPGDWARRHLFSNWYNAVFTLLFTVVGAYALYRAFLFVFVNGQWEAVRRNLTLFMQGTFPRDEQWRLVTQMILFGFAGGVAAGAASGSAEDRAREAGLPFSRSTTWETVKRFWSVELIVLVMLAMVETFLPVLLVGLAVVGLLVGYQVRRLGPGSRMWAWLGAALLLLAGFQVVSGTADEAWIWTAAVIGIGVWSFTDRLAMAPGVARVALRLGVTLASAVVVWALYAAFGSEGIGWDSWAGLHLTLMSAAVAITLSFPLGLLLALGRRSSLPALSWMSTAYIELIRGVPMISLLLMGEFFLGFFLDTETPLSRITRAIAAMTLFTAAYVAEIVRGGLQALPKGQTEAGQALGLAPFTITQRIVLPQALRAVIPAMVGQFISLFKDTSLLSILGINEFLKVRELVHAQPDFRGIAIAETLVFVAVVYWAFTYAMSRESQRLERRLGVGHR